MLEWLAEINWMLVVFVTAGCMVGGELGRRRVEKKGERYSFLPRSTKRVLDLGSVVSGVLTYEAARVAVSMPTPFHVWMLIFAAGAAFILFGISSSLELKAARALIGTPQEGKSRAPELG